MMVLEVITWIGDRLSAPRTHEDMRIKDFDNSVTELLPSASRLGFGQDGSISMNRGFRERNHEIVGEDRRWSAALG